MKDLSREKYLSRIRPFYGDADVIKVITGVRRCGKSTVMRQIVQELLDSGVEPSMIAYLDLDSKRYRKVSNAEELEAEIDLLIPSAIWREMSFRKPMPVMQIRCFHFLQGLTGFPVCPQCGRTMEREYQPYCDRCGQCLDWSVFSKATIILPHK